MSMPETKALIVILLLFIFAVGAFKIQNIKNDNTKAIVAMCTKIVLGSFLVLTVIILLVNVK